MQGQRRFFDEIKGLNDEEGFFLSQNQQMAFSAAFYLAASQPSADFALVSLFFL